MLCCVATLLGASLRRTSIGEPANCVPHAYIPTHTFIHGSHVYVPMLTFPCLYTCSTWTVFHDYIHPSVHPSLCLSVRPSFNITHDCQPAINGFTISDIS